MEQYIRKGGGTISEQIMKQNTMKRHIQFMMQRDNFLEQVWEWLLAQDNERMRLLRQFIFEVELSETEELKEVLYEYGSHLTEKNYLERKFFECMAELVRRMERNRRAAAMEAE